MKYRNAEWTSLEHLRIKVTAPTKNMKTTAEIHNIVYIVNSYVCVGILKSWIRKRVIKDFCLNVQIQRKLHASRQRSIKMFCSSTIICSVCFVRKSLFQIGNKWSAIEFLFLNEALPSCIWVNLHTGTSKKSLLFFLFLKRRRYKDT